MENKQNEVKVEKPVVKVEERKTTDQWVIGPGGVRMSYDEFRAWQESERD